MANKTTTKKHTKSQAKRQAETKPQAYPYFSRTRLIEVARLGQKWNYNRQLDDSVKELPIARYPVVGTLPHHHRNGVRCEEHVRCLVAYQEGLLIFDVPTVYFARLPWLQVIN